MQNLNYFGQKLTQLRKEKRLSRRELAQKLGINENTLTGYEREGREPRYDLLIKIADFFRVRVDELLRQNTLKVDWFIEVDGDQYEINGCNIYEPNYDLSPEFEEISMQNFVKNFVYMLWGFLEQETQARDFYKDEYKSLNYLYPKKSSEINIHSKLSMATLNLNLKIERNLNENNLAKEENLNGEKVDN